MSKTPFTEFSFMFWRQIGPDKSGLIHIEREEFWDVNQFSWRGINSIVINLEVLFYPKDWQVGFQIMRDQHLRLFEIDLLFFGFYIQLFNWRRDAEII